MPTAPQTPAEELADLAAWLDDRAMLLDNLALKRMPPAVRAQLKRYALDARGRAVLARTQLCHAGLTPEAAAQAGAGCEHCPAGGGGCSVCLGR